MRFSVHWEDEAFYRERWFTDLDRAVSFMAWLAVRGISPRIEFRKP